MVVLLFGLVGCISSGKKFCIDTRSADADTMGRTSCLRNEEMRK